MEFSEALGLNDFLRNRLNAISSRLRGLENEAHRGMVGDSFAVHIVWGFNG